MLASERTRVCRLMLAVSGPVFEGTVPPAAVFGVEVRGGRTPRAGPIGEPGNDMWRGGMLGVEAACARWRATMGTGTGGCDGCAIRKASMSVVLHDSP
jgi:hypothetical protein